MTPFDGARVGDLLQALGLDDGVGRFALGPHRLEHFLGDLAGDGLVDDPLQQAAQLRGQDARVP